jgi:hypothetical protein
MCIKSLTLLKFYKSGTIIGTISGLSQALV